ncbi:MAG: ATP-binding cassette domain-containing protein [Clostridia bacterium]|nr:ATP-binding cassette domain-containing protein [Clostridia bacterium]
MTLIEAKDLTMYFSVGKSFFSKGRKTLKAVDGVNFSVEKGTAMGLVGESGCGKTTVGRCLVRLYEPTAGSVLFDGQDITHMPPKELLPVRHRMQMIFQDPYASLDPRMTVESIVGEPLYHRSDLSSRDKADKVAQLIDTVGLKRDHLQRYPHEFSGGQRQRIGIARALASDPEFIVCDEPISALDVSIQAQIINTLEALQEKLGLTYLFVSHDLRMIRHISQKVGVMYLGCLVEMAEVEELFNNMLHPYTKALFSAAPIPDPDAAAATTRIHLKGDVPTPIDPPAGCRFRSRCPIALPVCSEMMPKLRDMGDGHCVACHRV